MGTVGCPPEAAESPGCLETESMGSSTDMGRTPNANFEEATLIEGCDNTPPATVSGTDAALLSSSLHAGSEHGAPLLSLDDSPVAVLATGPLTEADRCADPVGPSWLIRSPGYESAGSSTDLVWGHFPGSPVRRSPRVLARHILLTGGRNRALREGEGQPLEPPLKRRCTEEEAPPGAVSDSGTPYNKRFSSGSQLPCVNSEEEDNCTLGEPELVYGDWGAPIDDLLPLDRYQRDRAVMTGMFQSLLHSMAARRRPRYGCAKRY